MSTSWLSAIDLLCQRPSSVLLVLGFVEEESIIVVDWRIGSWTVGSLLALVLCMAGPADRRNRR